MDALARRAPSRAIWLAALCACGGESSAPTPSPPSNTSSSAVATVDAADTARLRAEHERVERDIAAYDREREVDDPANHGSGWTKWLPDAHADLWGVYADGDDVLAVGQDAAILRSLDGGASWRAIEAPALRFQEPFEDHPALIAKVIGSGPRRLVIGDDNSLVGVSSDGGETWDRVTFGGSGSYRIDGKAEPTGAFLSGTDAYVSDVAVVHVSHDGGATWRAPALTIARDDNDVGNEGIRGLAGSPDGGAVYAYGQSRQKPWLAVSRDRGRSWQLLARSRDLAHQRTVLDLAVAPDRTMYATFGADGSDELQLGTSRDGASWVFQPVGGDGWSWVAPDGTIFEGKQASSDRGKTWRRELGYSPMAMAFTKTAVFAVGHHGEVWIKRLAR